MVDILYRLKQFEVSDSSWGYTIDFDVWRENLILFCFNYVFWTLNDRTLNPKVPLIWGLCAAPVTSTVWAMWDLRKRSLQRLIAVNAGARSYRGLLLLGKDAWILVICVRLVCAPRLGRCLLVQHWFCIDTSKLDYIVIARRSLWTLEILRACAVVCTACSHYDTLLRRGGLMVHIERGCGTGPRHEAAACHVRGAPSMGVTFCSHVVHGLLIGTTVSWIGLAQVSPTATFLEAKLVEELRIAPASAWDIVFWLYPWSSCLVDFGFSEVMVFL